MRVIGDQILAELEKVDSEVSVAWDAYYSTANQVFSGGLMKPKALHRAGSTATEDDVAENTIDVWLVEMHYRVAVSYQTSAWEKGSAELTKLFSSMKEMECQRRLDLREFMVAFMQRQDRLFTALPLIHAPVLQELVEREMDKSSLEGTVQAAIRKRAEKLQREELKNKEKEKKEPTSSPLKGVNVEDGNFTLASPLLSDLLCKTKVIERKNFGMMSTWKLCLVVITSDAFAHMFDIPNARVSLGSAPEVAFQTLVPEVQVPSAETIKSGKSNLIKGWCDSLTPTETLNLMNCKLVFGFDGSTLDVQETTVTTGASKVFGKTTKRKLSLKFSSKLESQDFMFAVNQVQGELE